MVMTTTQDYVEFQVMACREAHIALYNNSADLGLHNYEVVIGSQRNTQVQINLPFRGRKVASVFHPDLLHCFTMRKFWIDWKDGVLRVGRSNYPSGV